MQLPPSSSSVSVGLRSLFVYERTALKKLPNSLVGVAGLGLSILLAGSAPLQAQPAYEVKDIAPGSASSPLSDFGVLGGRLFFAASDPTNGVELWTSYGTPGGTAMLKDIWTGSGNSNPHFFTRVGNTLFFTRIYNTLMKTDGTAAGTVEVANFASCRSLTNVAGTLFFAGDDGFGNGDELWKSDGTPGGTVMVKDIYPGLGNSGLITNPTMVAVGSTVFFVANDGTHGYELWKSDGTGPGTVMVKDIRPGALDGVDSLLPQAMVNVNGVLFFVADDGVNGRELWKSDGTTPGTVMVKDINIYGSSNPSWLTNVGGILYFAAAEDDGTAYGSELMRSDGTAAGTFRVKDIVPGPLSGNPSNLTDFNGTLLFSASDLTHGFELWRSDGTDVGTVLVKDINPGVGDGFPYDAFVANTIVIGNRMFFRADDGTSGLEL